MTKKIFCREIPTAPALTKSISTGSTMPGRPPRIEAEKRALEIARVRSAGLGEIAADMPQNGTSQIV